MTQKLNDLLKEISLFEKKISSVKEEIEKTTLTEEFSVRVVGDSGEKTYILGDFILSPNMTIGEVATELSQDPLGFCRKFGKKTELDDPQFYATEGHYGFDVEFMEIEL